MIDPLYLVAAAASIATLTVSPAARGFVRDRHAATHQAIHDAFHIAPHPGATATEQRRRAHLLRIAEYQELVARADAASTHEGALPFADDLSA